MTAPRKSAIRNAAIRNAAIRNAAIRNAAKLALYTTVGLLLWKIIEQAHVIRHDLAQAHAAPLWAAFGLCVIYRCINACGWGLVLKGVGHPLPMMKSAVIWMTSQALRWLPGTVWSIGSRVGQATAAGLPASVAGLSISLELGLTALAWLLAAVAGISLSGMAVDWLALLARSRWWVIGAALLIPLLAMIAARSQRLEPLLGRARSRFRGELLRLRAIKVRLPWVIGAFVFYLVLCGLNGFAFYLVVRAIAPAPVGLWAAIGINACGWIAGILAIGVPSGIGVREALGAALLASALGVPTAILATLVWRLVMTADELLCLGATVFLSTSGRPSPAADRPEIPVAAPPLESAP